MPRHNLFSNEEMRDMVCVYAQENFNGSSSHRRYLEMYPNRRQPDRKLFKSLYDRLGETGTFRPKRDSVGRPKSIAIDQEEEILVRVAENPEISSRRMALSTGVSKSSVLRIFHREKLHPYHFTPVQNLLAADFPARLQFARFFQAQQNAEQIFLNKILFTDEATFTRRGVFNFRNKHTWDTENPFLVTERHFQHEFKINIWCGIVGNYVLGPCELPPNLNGASYLNFLRYQMVDLFDDVSLNFRQNMYFMQDGAPAHFSLEVRNYLDNNFPGRWIGRGSQMPWPARSPDLNPMDFCFWGYMKSIVYREPINNRAELWQKIVNATKLFRNYVFWYVRVFLNLQFQTENSIYYFLCCSLFSEYYCALKIVKANISKTISCNDIYKVHLFYLEKAREYISLIKNYIQ
jgi:hypothetical protein